MLENYWPKYKVESLMKERIDNIQKLERKKTDM